MQNKKALPHLLQIMGSLFLTLSIVSCGGQGISMNKEESNQEEGQEESEVEAKRKADTKAWVEQIASQLVEETDWQEVFDQCWNEHIKSPKYQGQQAKLQRCIQQTMPRRSEREPILFINTGPGAFEPLEILYRDDVYSYDCLTQEITFRDGTSGYYPEALTQRDER